MNVYRVFYNTDNARGGLPTMRSIAIDIVTEKYKEVATVEAENVDGVFRDMNVVDGTELPAKLKIRSMCVGDLVLNVITEGAVYCAASGWVELDAKTSKLLKDAFS